MKLKRVNFLLTCNSSYAMERVMKLKKTLKRLSRPLKALSKAPLTMPSFRFTFRRP